MEIGWRLLAFLVALLTVVIVSTRWNQWQGQAGWQQTDDAYLAADLTPLAAKVAGYVRSVPTDDFERVRAGQVVAQLVDDDYRAEVDQATANVEAAQGRAETLLAQRDLQAANVRVAAAGVEAVRANLQQNSRDLDRQKQLLATGSSTLEAAERLNTTRAELNAQLDQSNAQVEAAQRQITVFSDQEVDARAAVKAEAARLTLARINLGYTQITAPQDGVLGQRQVRPGQYLSVGSQVTTLTPLPHVWVIPNYKETELTHMVVAQKAEVLADTFPGRMMHGHVVAFSPGSGAEFALLPPDNATGNFTKVVQRVAVKILIDDPAGLADQLRPGLSVVTRIDARARVASSR